MPSDPARPPRNLPGPGEPFNPREVFGSFGFGAFIPEKVAESTVLSMTAKVSYGHLVRRAGKNSRCWPSYRDIAAGTGIKERQAMRALKELAEAKLIRTIPRKNATGRQTSNEYEFIWGPILQGRGDPSDTLPPANSDEGRVARLAPTGVSETTPLEVTKINHHQGRNKERSLKRVQSTVQDASGPEPSLLSPKADDGDSRPIEYATPETN